MSFNLNKNDGPDPSSKKTGFDLSKNDATAADAHPAGGSSGKEAEPAGPSAPGRIWLYALFALLIIGGAGWYFSRDAGNGGEPGNAKVTADTVLASADSGSQAAPVKTDTAAIAASAANGQPVDTADNGAKPGAEKAQPVAIDPKSGIAPGGGSVAEAPAVGNKVNEGAGRFAASFSAGSSNPGNLDGGLPALIRKKLKTNGGLVIHVLGYASSEGSPEVNQRISQARADAYKRLLVQKGIAEANINAQGKGIENPVASNDTEAGRRKNRRVEVLF